jgi:hypothetical protein
MDFYEWFTTFLEEKEIDMSEFCENGIQVGDVCQAICDTNSKEQSQIKEILVLLDCKNGNIYHFLNHLSGALNKKDIDKRREELGIELLNQSLASCRERKQRK